MNKLTEEVFYNSIEKWIQDDVKKWNTITLLAYFCYKYQFKNKNNPYQERFKLTRAANGVALSKEAKDFNKLFKLLAPENYSELSSKEKSEIREKVNWEIRNYINWTIDVKFARTERTVQGTDIFWRTNVINEFKIAYKKYLSKEQTSNKFELLLSWCQKEADGIFERHQLEEENDLKLIKRYADQYALKESSLERRVLAKAIEVGLLR